MLVLVNSLQPQLMIAIRTGDPRGLWWWNGLAWSWHPLRNSYPWLKSQAGY